MTISVFQSGDTVTVNLVTTDSENTPGDPDGNVMLTLYGSDQTTEAVVAFAMTRTSEAHFTASLTLPEGTDARTYYAKARWTSSDGPHAEGVTIRTVFARS